MDTVQQLMEFLAPYLGQVMTAITTMFIAWLKKKYDKKVLQDKIIIHLQNNHKLSNGVVSDAIKIIRRI